MSTSGAAADSFRQLIQKIVSTEPHAIGFGRRGTDQRSRRALVLGIDVRGKPPKRVPDGANFVVVDRTAVAAMRSIGKVPVGIRGIDAHELTEEATPEFVVLDVRTSSASLLRDGAGSKLLEVDGDTPLDLMRPIAALEVAAVVAPLSQRDGAEPTVSDVLRLGFVVGSVRQPVLARATGRPDKAVLETLARIGVAGILVSLDVTQLDLIAEIAKEIDGIDPKIRDRRGDEEDDRAPVLPFVALRPTSEEAEEPEE